MKKSNIRSGFALAITLVLLALIVIVVVAFLASTRIERSTSSLYANRLRAKMTADSALSAAIHLLQDNTRYGNYITAMPAPVPSPAPHYTELYRPTDPADPTHAVKANEYLQLSNAAGEILISRAAPTPTASPIPQVDPRPTPEAIVTPLPAGNPFALSTPAPILSSANSYDFNQIVRLGTNSSGRLVNPDGQPAFGQWVNVRNTANPPDVIGRYAFFIEDESMKVNVNSAGNNVGGINTRVNDLASPTPSPTPASQIQETDPAAVLPATSNRSSADAALTSLGSTGDRLPSRSTLALLNEWGSATNAFSNYAHLTTISSRDDDATAKGWTRLDINKIVTDAQTVNTAQAKKDAAMKIANWIRDAWTGPTPIASLSDYQLYGDDWSRKQIAANIVDYVDTDSSPTDMGDIIPAGFTSAVPVVGIEKTPHLSGVNIIFQASDSTYPGAGTGTFAATIKVRIQLHFLNLYDAALDLADVMGNTSLSRIEVTGLPIIRKNGLTPSVYDASSQTFTIKLSDLLPVNGSGTIVPAGTDGTSTSGARTFQTNWIDTRTGSFTVTASDQNPKFLAANVTVKIIGNKTGNSSDDYRVDDTAIVTSAVTTKWCNTCSSAGDFLKESTSSAGALQIASVNYVAGYQGAIVAGQSPGDPRYRGRLVGDRWNNDQSRTDASGANNKVDSLVDKADINPRAYGLDWFDNAGDRPLGFIRNAPMLNIGELGNVATCEYPWRTLYLQYPERPASTVAAGPAAEIPLRRSKAMDYVLVDLFRTNSGSSRAGALNINTQQRYGSVEQHALAPLFLGQLIGTVPSLTQTMVNRLCTNTGVASSTTIFDHRIDPNNPVDNKPLRPFFQPGELASVVSRLVNSSVAGSGTTGSPGRSTVNYSLLRTNATTASESPVNANIHQDMQVEQEFREISNSITTRGNSFRILYVGQTLKKGVVQAEWLSEAFVERQSKFAPEGSNPDALKIADSTYTILANRTITE